MLRFWRRQCQIERWNNCRKSNHIIHRFHVYVIESYSNLFCICHACKLSKWNQKFVPYSTRVYGEKIVITTKWRNSEDWNTVDGDSQTKSSRRMVSFMFIRSFNQICSERLPHLHHCHIKSTNYKWFQSRKRQTNRQSPTHQWVAICV